MINWRLIKIESIKDLKRIMCLPPKINIFKKTMLNINRQLTQTLRTINRIWFVRLQKRDGMAWISIFKPAPPGCVTKSSEPPWKGKLPLRSSVPRPAGGNKNHGEAWQEPAQTGSVRVRGGGDQLQERCKCPHGVRVPRVRAAALSEPNVHLRLAEPRGPGDLGPPGPAQGLVEAELLLQLGQLPGVQASPRGHVDRVTVRAHAAAAEPTGQARPGWKQGTRK